MLLKMEGKKWAATLQVLAQLVFVSWTLVTIHGLQQRQLESPPTIKGPYSDDRLQTLEDQLAVANARVENLEEQRSDADRRIRLLEDQLVTLVTDKQTLQEQLADLDRKNQWLQEQLSALMNDDRLKFAAEQGATAARQAHHRHLPSAPTNGVIGVCVPEIGGQLYAVDSRSECSTGEYYLNWAELSLVQTYLAELRSDISALQTNTSDNAAQITANAEQIRTGISQLRDLRQDMEAVESSLASLNTSVSHSADTIDMVNWTVSWLNADVTNLTVDMEEVKTEVFEYDYSRTVFVTSSSHRGDFGGIEGGDAICQQLADSSSLVPNGTYVAWLSNSTINATDRFDDSSRFENLDGSLIAGGLQELLSGSLDTGILFDDTGEEYNETEGSFAWTGTSAAGVGTSHHCNDWTDSNTSLDGNVGIVGATTSSWSSFTTLSCRGLRRLFCFRFDALRDASPIAGRPSRVETLEANLTSVMESVQTLSDQVGILNNEVFPTAPPTPQAAPAYVFVTSTEMSNGNLGGLDGADAICQSLADAAELSVVAGREKNREYKAWLSNGTLSVNDRFHKLYDESYIRVDGTVIATDWDDLTDGTIGATISLKENGESLLGERVWTGTDANGDSASDHCTGWTSGTSGVGEYGETDRTDLFWSSGPIYGCDRQGLRLYCFAQ